MVRRFSEETETRSDTTLQNLNTDAIQQIQTTSLPVELVGTMEGPRQYRLATLRNLKSRNIRSLAPGETWNNLTLKKIQDGSVILRNRKNSRTEMLRLKRKYLEKPDKTKSRQDVRKVSRYEINQSIQNNMNNILTSVNPQPVIRNGRIAGIKVAKMEGRPGKLLKKLGFKKNDVIQRVNGEKVDSIEKAMSLWTQLRNKRRVKFTILRNGDKQVLEYSLTR
jgi:general secretion pathway protein C